MQSSDDSPKVSCLVCIHIGKIHYFHDIGFVQHANDASYIFNRFGIHRSKVSRIFDFSTDISRNSPYSGKIP